MNKYFFHLSLFNDKTEYLFSVAMLSWIYYWMKHCHLFIYFILISVAVYHFSDCYSEASSAGQWLKKTAEIKIKEKKKKLIIEKLFVFS